METFVKKRRIVRTVMMLLTYKMDVLLLFHDKCHSWMGPGGKVEADELIFEAAIRELREEAGIDFGDPQERMSSYPLGNDRVKQSFLPFRVLTYLGGVKEDSYDVLEDQIFWQEVMEERRLMPLVAPEGHPIGWFDLRTVLNDPGFVIQPEVRKNLQEIYAKKLSRNAS